MVKHDDVAPVFQKFAAYYDLIYSKLHNYEVECSLVNKILLKHSRRRPRIILDVACGTGADSYEFAKLGYAVHGIDSSAQMIGRAVEKRPPGATNPVFNVMDMREINLRLKFDAALALFGGFGYLLNHSDVSRFLRGVRKHVPEGPLIFEFWQTGGVRSSAFEKGGYRTWVRVEDDAHRTLLLRLDTFVAEKRSSIVTLTMDFYVVDLAKGKLIDRFTETHVKRTYTARQLQTELSRSGYRVAALYELDTVKKVYRTPGDDSFRVLCVAEPKP
ncbi:MAG: class I SAM-dependent methyltransferase [Thermoprotei archaeon]